MKRSLHRRLLLWVASTSITTLMLALIATFSLVESQLRLQFDNALQARMRSLMQLVEQNNGTIDFEWNESGSSVSPIASPGDRLTCWASGDVIQIYPIDSSPLSIPQQLGQIESVQFRDSHYRLASVQFVPRSEHGDDTSAVSVLLALAAPIEQLELTIATIWWSMFGVLLIGLVLTALGTLVAVNRGLQPLAATADEVNIHANDNLDFDFRQLSRGQLNYNPC